MGDGWELAEGVLPEPHLGASQAIEYRVGNCREMADLATYVMRSLGIPIGNDFLPQWPQRNLGHNWNVVFDTAGRSIMFLGTELYATCSDIKIPLMPREGIKHAYLALFNNTTWVPVDWVGLDFGKPVKIDSIRFAAGLHTKGPELFVVPGHTYQLVVWDKGQWNLVATQKARASKRSDPRRSGLWRFFVNLVWNGQPVDGFAAFFVTLTTLAYETNRNEIVLGGPCYHPLPAISCTIHCAAIGATRGATSILSAQYQFRRR